MRHWPGKTSFESGVIDYKNDMEALQSISERAQFALIHENLALLSSLSAKAPEALFFEWSSQKNGDPDTRALQTLRVKDHAFCFDAGLAWASAIGSTANDPDLQETLKSNIHLSIISGIERRRPFLAFACGAMQAPLFPNSFSDWLWTLGVEAYSIQHEFGAIEVDIWGDQWRAQAIGKNDLPRLSALVLSQALAQRWLGLEDEASALVNYAKTLGPPENNWLGKAISNASPILKTQERNLKMRLLPKKSINEVERISREQAELWSERLEQMGADLCSEGPASWSEHPLPLHAKPSLKARVEQAALSHATAAVGGIKTASGPRI